MIEAARVLYDVQISSSNIPVAFNKCFPPVSKALYKALVFRNCYKKKNLQKLMKLFSKYFL